MKKITITILSVLALTGVVFGGWYYMNFEKYAPDAYVTDTPTGSVTVDTTTGVTSTSTKNFTLSELSTHKDVVSCYSAISGSVYDLTMWVNMHPGGKGPILSICGVDGTEKFMNKHHGKPKFITILARFKIGTLTQ